MEKRELAAIILAAGKGKRMQAKTKNKVVFHLGNKPLIVYIIEKLCSLSINQIVVVVGFARKSVEDALQSFPVTFVTQSKRLGTAHALQCGIAVLPKHISDVLLMQGDDSAFYSKEIIKKLVAAHYATNASITLLTIEVENPYGLGRIVREKNNKIIAVVEEKDATEAQRLIREINPACYVFSLSFLKKNLSKIKKSPVTGEYYVTGLIDLAVNQNEQIHTVSAGKIPWRGVNTPTELEEAKKMLSEISL